MKLTDLYSLFNEETMKDTRWLFTNASEPLALKKKYTGVAYEVYRATGWEPLEEADLYAEPWFAIVRLDEANVVVGIPSMELDAIKYVYNNLDNQDEYMIVATTNEGWELVGN